MLDVSHNQLKAISSNIVQLHQLQDLSLHTNDLSNLPTELFRLSNLRGLSLHHNRLDHHAFPFDPSKDETVQTLENITVLDLSANKFGEIPPQICTLTTLQELYLAGNKLTYIREENFPFSKLSNLRVLDLSCNNITKLGPVASS